MPTDKSLLERETIEEEGTDIPEYCCTVVSLLPFELLEEKPHILPGSYRIPSADGDEPGLLHVREGIQNIPNPLIEEGRPGASIKQVTTPAEMSRSICEDYNNAHVALTEDASPALFWVPGKLSRSDIHKFHGKRLNAARARMKNWFKNLCIMADSDWEKNHDMRAVSDLQRAAANYLGIKRDWVDFEIQEMDKCPYCQVQINKEASVCHNCKQVINAQKFADTQKAFDPANLFAPEVKNV